MIRTLSLVGVLVANACLIAAPPTPEQIQKAVEDLGSPRFAVRERASKLLWQAGAAAEAAVREAAKSSDTEVSQRATALLEKFDWGIYPDTPADVLQQIQKFQSGPPEQRLEATQALMKMRPYRFQTLRKIVVHEQDAEARAALFSAMSQQAREVVPVMIVAGQLDDANEMLDVCLTPHHNFAFDDYAALHFLRGTTAEAIKVMKRRAKSANAGDAAIAAEALVYLHRVRRDWPAAKAAAEKLGTPQLKLDVAWEANDWATLLSVEAPDISGLHVGVHRLAGNVKATEAALAELRQGLAAVEAGDGEAHLLALTLLYNGRGREAVEVLKERPGHQPEVTFELLAAQLKFKEAFALADKARNLPQVEDDVSPWRLESRRIRLLALIGEKDSATQAFRKSIDEMLAKARYDVAGFSIREMVAIGMRDLALEATATCMAHAERRNDVHFGYNMMLPAFEEHSFTAEAIWKALRKADPKADAAKLVAEVDKFLAGRADPKAIAALADKVLKASAEEPIRDGTGSAIAYALPPAVFRTAMAEVYRTAGNWEKAEAFYRKALEAKDHQVQLRYAFVPGGEVPETENRRQNYLIRYADMLLERGRPKDAAPLYRQAWELEPDRPLPLFLEGHARKLAGDEKEGLHRMERAHWIGLGSEAAREYFAAELIRRGFEADMRREYETLLATGWSRSGYMDPAFSRQARLAARKGDFATAAKILDKEAVGLARTGSSFVEPKGLLIVPEMANVYKAKAQLAAGKLDDAMATARASLKNLPGHVDLAVGLVPDLAKAGRTKEADEIYKAVTGEIEKAIREFGSSAELRNSLAWTMVNCNRDLEAALAQASKAVELNPRSAASLDTLAEVHFRKRDRAKAQEAIRKCLALEPTNAYYRKQVERFSKRPFDSPLPDEITGED